MWDKLRALLKSPIFENDPEKTRQAGVLWIILSTAVFAVPAYLATFFFTGRTPNNVAWFVSLGLEAVFIATLVAVRVGWVRPVGYFLSTAFWGAGTFAAYRFGGMREMALQFHFLVLILAGTTIGIGAVTGYFIASMAAFAFLLFGEYQGFIVYALESPTPTDDAIVPILALLVSALLLRNAIRSLNQAQAETQAGADALAEANVELETAQLALTQQSGELARRATFLEATTTVAQETSMLLDQPERLFTQITESISNQLGVYHVGLYVFDATGNNVQLIAASSEGGRELVRRGFRLPVSDRLEDRSIAGWVATRNEAYLMVRVEDDPRFRPLPELPETRSEITLPLLSAGQVIGVLDLQSNRDDDFAENDVVMLQILAGQAAMMMNNAQLVSQLGQAVATQRRLSADVGRENWLELIRGAADVSFVSDDQGVSRTGGVMQPEMQTAVNQGTATVSPENPRMLAVPVRARGEVVAVIDATLPESMAAWTPETIGAVEAMAEQLGTALEGARLYQQTTQRAATEQITREVTAAMRSSLQVDSVLQATLKEISDVLKVEQVQVRLGVGGKEVSA